MLLIPLDDAGMKPLGEADAALQAPVLLEAVRTVLVVQKLMFSERKWQLTP